MTGNQFKEYRERLELSQEQLALILGLSGKKAVSNIETGFRNPSRLSVALIKILVELPEKKSRELQTLLSRYLTQNSSFVKKVSR